jgi:hypothetical protein
MVVADRAVRVIVEDALRFKDDIAFVCTVDVSTITPSNLSPTTTDIKEREATTASLSIAGGTSDGASAGTGCWWAISAFASAIGSRAFSAGSPSGRVDVIGGGQDNMKECWVDTKEAGIGSFAVRNLLTTRPLQGARLNAAKSRPNPFRGR